MQRYKLITMFDGTQYSGWQVQPNHPTIQAQLQRAFAMILGYPVHVTGCGRTDAGVHAKAHVSHVTLNEEIDSLRVLFKLGGLLPKDIQVISIEKVGMDFHARYHARKKTYAYHLHLDRSISPFKRLYCHHVRAKLDLDRMQTAASYLVGTHDFTSFAHQARQGCARYAPVKTIYRAEFIQEEGGAVFEICGSGFLHKMVRNIVGTLIDVGKGKMTLTEFQELLTIKDRRKAGKTAPPQGLFLKEVLYDESTSS